MWREVRRKLFGSDDVPDEQAPRPPEPADEAASEESAAVPPRPHDAPAAPASGRMPDRAVPITPLSSSAPVGDVVDVSPPGHAPQGLAAEEPGTEAAPLADVPAGVASVPPAQPVAPAHETASVTPEDAPAAMTHDAENAPVAIPRDADESAPPVAPLPELAANAAEAPAALAADDDTAAPGVPAVSDDIAAPGAPAVSEGTTAAAALEDDATPGHDAPATGAPAPLAARDVPAAAADDAAGQDVAVAAPGSRQAPAAPEAPTAQETAGSEAPTAQEGAEAAPDTQQAEVAPGAVTDAQGAEAAEVAEAAPAATEAAPDTAPVFGPLDAGVTVGDRYRIVALAAAADPATETLTYGAVDTRSYEHCWSCGSTANGPGTRFCQNCGAPVQDHPVTLVQTRAATGDPGEVEHDGAYFHVEPERRQFGAEGMGIEIGAYSAEGPHHPNEDSYWYVTRTLCANSSRQSAAVAIFADGMGGYAPGSGLISSRIAAAVGKSIVAALDERFDTPGTLDAAAAEAVVRAAIGRANQIVLDEIARTGEMGATLVTVLIHGDTAYVANVGDSRAYYVDPHGRGAAITRDQSLVAQQVQFGQLAESDIYTAPGNNIILHAIGEEGAQDAADWYAQPLEPGSYLLLCSDGYWKTRHGAVLPDGVLRDSDTMSEAARRMVDLALTEGSDDNTTVVLIAVS